MKTLASTLGYGIFWLWNLTFLLIVYAGILPIVGGPLIQATFAGQIQSEFLWTLLALVAIPTGCTILGFARFRRRSQDLLRLFYAVEAPLFVLCLIRLFALRELTPASAQIIGTLVLCAIAFLLDMLWGYFGDSERSQPFLPGFQLVAHSLMFLAGLYAGTLLLFYAVPIAWLLMQGFFSFVWVGWLADLWDYTFRFGNIVELWWLLLFVLLFFFSATLFVAMPSAMATFYILSGRNIVRQFAAQYGKVRAWVGAIAAGTAWVAIFFALQQQPQVRAFELLASAPQTQPERAELLDQSKAIRAGLLNAYLADYRYLQPRSESRDIYQLYQSVFHFSDAIAQKLQGFYNQLLSPFLYQGEKEDYVAARKLYAEFFDTPIQKGERKAVRHALKSTANRDEAKAGLLNIDRHTVWLREQAIEVQDRGAWGEVELYERYENKTNEVQEVFYSFSLPESAVITGLWLGDTPDRDNRFPFQISPRGAAQEVYNSQVRRERPIDPALLEQVGPRHYRLRAFPIPRPLAPNEKAGSRPTEMNLWLTYTVMRQPEGWAMPQLGEKRNLFWTGASQRSLNGKRVKDFQDSWLPAFAAADPVTPESLETTLEGYQIAAKPLADSDYALPQNRRFAVILDTSVSMRSRRSEVEKAFEWLDQNGFADNQFANNDVDLYLTSAAGMKPQRLDDVSQFKPQQFPFFGTLRLPEMLQQFQNLKGETAYDGVILLTDEGSYELSDESQKLPELSAPLWFVHLGGQLPPAYDDATLAAMQNSGGGVATKLSEVLQQGATLAKFGPSTVSIADGYLWSMQAAEGKTATESGFAPLAAKQLVTGLSRQLDESQLANLDAIHAIAQRAKIVTPYSSAIVLVNDAQRQALKAAESRSDRFQREVESGQEELERPASTGLNPFNVSAVPEPDLWMLLGLGAIALLWVRQRTRSLS